MNILKSFFGSNQPKNESENPTPSFEIVGKPDTGITQEPIKTTIWGAFLNIGINNNTSEKEIDFARMRYLAKNVTEVASCVNTLCSFLTRVKFDFRDVKSKEINKLNVKRVSKIFTNNKHLSFRQLQELIIGETAITDALTIYPVRNRAGEVIRFRVLDGANVQVILNDYQEVAGYKYQVAVNKHINYSTDDLLYKPKNQSANKFYGCSYVEQLAETCELLLAKRRETKDYYEQGNYPNLLISLPEAMAPEDIKGFEKYWNMTTKGIKKAMAKFIPGGSQVHFTKENVTGEDLQIERYQREVYSIFRLSPSLLIKDSNRATAEVSSRIAEEVGMLDMLDWVCGVINDLIKYYINDDTVECFYTIDTVVDQEKEARVHQIYIQSGVLTVNEVREALGKKPLKLEEMPKKDDNNSNNDDEEVPEDEEKSKGFLTNLITKSSKTDEFDKELEKNEEALVQLLTQYLITQDRNVKSILNTYDLKKITENEIGLMVDIPEKRLEEIVDEINDKLFDIGLVSVEKAFTLNNNYNNAEAYEKAVAEAEKYALSRSAELIGKKFVNGKLIDNPNAKMAITETTRATLKGLIDKAIEEGWSNDTLAIEIKNSGTFTEKRAMTIARTETSFAENDITMKSYNEMGVKKKLWLTARDNQVCEDCLKNEQQGAVGLNDKFFNGKIAPPSHPNCRCALAPVVEE